MFNQSETSSAAVHAQQASINGASSCLFYVTRTALLTDSKCTMEPAIMLFCREHLIWALLPISSSDCAKRCLTSSTTWCISTTCIHHSHSWYISVPEESTAWVRFDQIEFPIASFHQMLLSTRRNAATLLSMLARRTVLISVGFRS